MSKRAANSTVTFDLLIVTLLLIGSKQRLATIVALQANLDIQP
jgi:hypothetical protein